MSLIFRLIGNLDEMIKLRPCLPRLLLALIKIHLGDHDGQPLVNHRIRSLLHFKRALVPCPLMVLLLEVIILVHQVVIGDVVVKHRRPRPSVVLPSKHLGPCHRLLRLGQLARLIRFLSLILLCRKGLRKPYKRVRNLGLKSTSVHFGGNLNLVVAFIWYLLRLEVVVLPLDFTR